MDKVLKSQFMVSAARMTVMIQSTDTEMEQLEPSHIVQDFNLVEKRRPSQEA